MNWYDEGPFSILDIETTGFSTDYDRIIQVAIKRINLDGSIEKFSTFINPERYIPKRITQLTKISDNDVINSPKFIEIADELLNFLDGSILVAHNAKFDLRFIQHSLQNAGRPQWSGKTMDTIAICKTIYPGLKSYKLGELQRILNIDVESSSKNLHNAEYDVDLTFELLKHLFTIVLENNK